MLLPFDPQQIKAIFFDLDGTLIDTDGQAVSALAQRLRLLVKLLGRDPHRVARRLVMWAETPGNAVVTLLDWLSLDDNIFRLGDRLRSWRGLHPRAHLPLVPNAGKMLVALKPHYRLGIVTTRGQRDARSFIAQHDLHGLFEIEVTRETTSRLKPHPAPLLYATQRLHLSPKHCLMVGDTTTDVLAGIRAGLWTVATLSGFGERPELERAGAHLVIDSTAELHRVLGIAVDGGSSQPPPLTPSPMSGEGKSATPPPDIGGKSVGSHYTLEGQGVLLQHGRLIAHVDYHLSLPTQAHLITSANPTLKPGEHLAGFILLPQSHAGLPLQTYTLELDDKQRLPIVVERRYKVIKHRGETRISYWVTLARK